MNYKELKQYIEKELQAKKFLQEGLDAINNLESLDRSIKELGKEAEKATEQRDLAKAELAAINKQIVVARNSLDTTLKHGAEMTEKAKAIAAAIEAKATKNAAATKAAADEELAAVSAKIRETEEELVKLRATRDAVAKDVEEIRAVRAKLLAKYN